MKKKMYLIDVKNETTRVVDAGGLDDYYNLIGCTCIDIVRRKIGGKYFEIVSDDEGLFEENPKISAVDKLYQTMLVGNLLIAGQAVDGELTDLSDEDVEIIGKNLCSLSTSKYPRPYKMLTGCGY